MDILREGSGQHHLAQSLAARQEDGMRYPAAVGKSPQLIFDLYVSRNV